jgi:hypothetical protein
MTSQNQVKNSADAPNPYGGVEGVQESDLRQAQGTDSGAGVGGSPVERQEHQALAGEHGDVGTGHHKHPSGLGTHTHSHHGASAAAGHYAGEYNSKEGPFPGAASGATGGSYGEQPAQQGAQQMQGSNFEGVPGTATWGMQRAQTDSGPQRKPPESKGVSGNGTQTGREGAERASTTAGAGGGRGGAASPGTGTTGAPGTGSGGIKGVVSGVHVSLHFHIVAGP